jgi:protein SCO1
MSLRYLGLIAISSIVLATACRASEAKTFNPDGLAGPKISPPVPKPDFVMPTTEGKPFDFRKDTEGFVTLLFFGYTHCPDVCPVHLANIAEALSKAGPEVSNGVKVVFVTTDPARDTPAVVRAWLDKFDTRFIGLVTDTSSVLKVLNQLQQGPITREQAPGDSTYYIGHSAIVMAFTRDNLAHVIYPFGVRQADWARDLELMVKGS